MSVNSALVIMDRISEVVNPLIAPAELKLKPGKFKADCAQDIDGAGMYNYMPNIYDRLTAVKTDALRVNLYHRRFEVLSNITTTVLEDLNKMHQLGIYQKLDGADDYTRPIEPGSPELYNSGVSTYGIKFHDINAVAGMITHNEFIDGTDFFTVRIDILYSYVEGDLS